MVCNINHVNRFLSTWITGPSAKGSEYGTPTSIISEPQESSTFNASAVVDKSGSPAVMKGINATFVIQTYPSGVRIEEGIRKKNTDRI